jgi:hypothetical protein
VKQGTTYVGIEAQKKDLFIAMLMGTQAVPVTWTVPNEPNAVRRLVRTLERKVRGLLRIIAARMALHAGTRPWAVRILSLIGAGGMAWRSGRLWSRSRRRHYDLGASPLSSDPPAHRLRPAESAGFHPCRAQCRSAPAASTA